MPASFDEVDGMDVIRIHKTSTTNRAQELSKPVYRHLFEWEVTEDGEGQSDCRVQMTTGVTTRNPDTDRDTKDTMAERRNLLVLRYKYTYLMPIQGYRPGKDPWELRQCSCL